MGFVPGMQGWFNFHKSASVIHPINKMKGKNHIISVYAKKKKIDKIPTSVHDKTLNRTLAKGRYLIILKAIYENPTVNFIPSNEKLSAFLLRAGTR